MSFIRVPESRRHPDSRVSFWRSPGRRVLDTLPCPRETNVYLLNCEAFAFLLLLLLVLRSLA